jgi:hypothetical protein
MTNIKAEKYLNDLFKNLSKAQNNLYDVQEWFESLDEIDQEACDKMNDAQVAYDKKMEAYTAGYLMYRAFTA